MFHVKHIIDDEKINMMWIKVSERLPTEVDCQYDNFTFVAEQDDHTGEIVIVGVEEFNIERGEWELTSDSGVSRIDLWLKIPVGIKESNNYE